MISPYTLRPLNGPQPVTVQADAAGVPQAVRTAQARTFRRVLQIQDCWRVDDEWWRERPIARVYRTLLLEDGGHLTVYHDLVDGGWYEQHDSGRTARR